uniref:LIM zinc-binding domain-containing protein n=1 Tax=Sinocyclocheilus rhinocerous TaxID=307959 RepID=A0A673H207_9TELE
THQCPTTEKVSSLGKDWHKFCLKCERCSKTLTAGGHAEHDGKPYCHKPCYAALFGLLPTPPHLHPTWTLHQNLRRNRSQHFQGRHPKVQTAAEINSN